MSKSQNKVVWKSSLALEFKSPALPQEIASHEGSWELKVHTHPVSLNRAGMVFIYWARRKQLRRRGCLALLNERCNQLTSTISEGKWSHVTPSCSRLQTPHRTVQIFDIFCVCSWKQPLRAMVALWPLAHLLWKCSLLWQSFIVGIKQNKNRLSNLWSNLGLKVDYKLLQSGRVSCSYSALVTEVAHTDRPSLLFLEGAQAQHSWSHSREVFIICMNNGTGKESVQEFPQSSVEGFSPHFRDKCWPKPWARLWRWVKPSGLGATEPGHTWHPHLPGSTVLCK